jgi:hypothetical protein
MAGVRSPGTATPFLDYYRRCPAARHFNPLVEGFLHRLVHFPIAGPRERWTKAAIIERARIVDAVNVHYRNRT